MVRSALAVLGGYAVFALSTALFFAWTSHDPQASVQIPFMVGAIGWGGFFGVISGYVAGRIAGRRETVHGTAVCFLIILVALVSMLTHPEAAKWSALCTMILYAPCAVLGGFIRSLFSGPSAFRE